jgi:hypothetical protein
MRDEDGPGSRDEVPLEALVAFLRGVIGAAAVEEIDLPHIVICHDAETGATSYAGPYPDGLAALAAAELESCKDATSGMGRPMEFSVAALYAD